LEPMATYPGAERVQNGTIGADTEVRQLQDLLAGALCTMQDPSDSEDCTASRSPSRSLGRSAKRLPALVTSETACVYQIQDVLGNALCSTGSLEETAASLLPETLQSGFRQDSDTLGISASMTQDRTLLSVRPDFEWTGLTEEPG